MFPFITQIIGPSPLSTSCWLKLWGDTPGLAWVNGESWSWTESSTGLAAHLQFWRLSHKMLPCCSCAPKSQHLSQAVQGPCVMGIALREGWKPKRWWWRHSSPKQVPWAGCWHGDVGGQEGSGGRDSAGPRLPAGGCASMRPRLLAALPGPLYEVWISPQVNYFSGDYITKWLWKYHSLCYRNLTEPLESLN